MKFSFSWEIFFYSFLLGVLVVGLYIANFLPAYFDENFAAEDGYIEYTTAILLICSSFLLVFRFINIGSEKKMFWRIGILISAILFFFAAGEEISWGQRLFNISSGEFFNEKNLQKETNLHNLTLGEVNLNKLIFGKLLTIFLSIYLLILPVLYKKSRWIKSAMDSFAVPIVQWHHVGAFIGSTIVILWINSERKWELYEFCFALIFLMIFLKPFNKHIYKIEK